MEESNKNLFHGKTVLLVDDDQDFIFQQNMLLEECGFHVIKASTAKEARDVISKESFDVAILDLMMDELDAGLTLSYEIKKRAKERPVILVTGVSSQTKLNFEKNGNGGGKGKTWLFADTVLSKPIRAEELIRELKRCL